MADETPDPKAAFAGLMSGAAKSAKPEEGETEAPYGYTVDGKPKKGPGGRPRKSPSLDELKAAKEARVSDETQAPGDETPSAPGRKRSKAKAEKAAEPTPQHRPGIITKGVNKLYRKAGKIVQVMDPAIGFAIIESTRNTADEGEADDSVGAAWDEVARTNPRIRKFLLKLIAGGAWGQLIMAHAPILLAILMKEGVAKHIPFMQLMQAFLSDGPDTDAHAAHEPDGSGAQAGGGGLSGLLDGLRPEDLEQMQGLAQQMMMGQAAKVADPNGTRAPQAAA